MNKKLILLLLVVLAVVIVIFKMCNRDSQCTYQNFSDAKSLNDTLNIYALNFEEFFQCLESNNVAGPIEVKAKDLPPLATVGVPACPPPMCRAYLERVAITRFENDTMIIYNNFEALSENVIVCTTEPVVGRDVFGFYKFKLPSSPIDYSNPIKIEIKRVNKAIQSIYISVK